jgi:hypothetical protein
MMPKRKKRLLRAVTGRGQAVGTKPNPGKKRYERKFVENPRIPRAAGFTYYQILKFLAY